MRTVALVFAIALSVSASAGEFDRPWKDPKATLIIDPFFDNPIDWEKLATEQRVVAVIHKSTIGTGEVDSAYFDRKREATKRGYLWGSYHWGVAGNPVEQADFYIDTVKPGADELIALDLEDVTSPRFMNANEALLFIKRVKQRLGRYPVLYTNHASAQLISARFRNTDFANTPLWYARFIGKVNDFPTGVWPTYTLWQFSSEIKRQLRVAGTRRDMDVNVFNGSVEKLKADWPLTRELP